MDQALRARIAELPPLGMAAASGVPCKICEARSLIFDIVDYNKICSETNPYEFGHSGIPVCYYRCDRCEFLFTNLFDNWNRQDFQTLIYNDDYIKVDGDYVEARPKRDAQFFLEFLASYHDISVLDYGGGTGMLASILREKGMDATCYDPFSHPVRPERRYDLIICMEVIEHSPDPVSSLRDMASFLADGGCIMVGTATQPADIDRIRGSWWYVGPRNGHVSLQSAASLIWLGRATGLTVYRSGYLQGFTENPSAVSRLLLEKIGRPAVDLRLCAPDIAQVAGDALTARPDDWHEVEESHWRWTARPNICWNWTPPAGGCDVRAKIPTFMQIEAGFVSQVRLFVDEQEVSVKVTGLELVADFAISGDDPVIIRLETPPPVVPITSSDASDRRELGLAIVVSGWH